MRYGKRGLELKKDGRNPTPVQLERQKKTGSKASIYGEVFLKITDDEGSTPTEREEKSSRAMYEAAKTGEVLGIARALAHGAVATWKNPDEDSKTALHACAQLKSSDTEDWKAIECAELLIQNGAKMDTRDKSDHGVLDSALVGNADVAMIEYLSTKAS
mmetsp:Transcript_1867/g.2937  ORF Transcript_1867/g.2937 Transcript_1867/m.2937 type:complete len:159 (-) Transcript_1867:204-680(-)